MRGLKIVMKSETDEFFAIMESHIKDYVGMQEYDSSKYDPVMYSKIDFDISRSYFIFNVFMEPSSVRDIEKELRERDYPIAIRNMTLHSPRNVKIDFYSDGEPYYFPILYYGCLFDVEPVLKSCFILKNCHFIL